MTDRKKRRPGRPSLAKGVSPHMTIRAPQVDLDRFRRLAMQSDTTLSAWALAKLREAANPKAAPSSGDWAKDLKENDK